MLVYREQERRGGPGPLLAAARERLDELAPAHEGVHDRVVRLLIDLGMLESGLADHLNPEADSPGPLTGALRAASVAAGHMLWHAWHGRPEAMAPWIDRMRTALGAVDRSVLPAEITLSVPEGFAQYGVLPETYLVAACRAARACPMPTAVCVGVRSIGTALSAVVTAALEELGRDVLSLTVRPHGHPFDRRPRFGDALTDVLRGRAGDLFLVVDEGPGISGSSLAGTARALEELGVDEDRIVLLPSWRTDGGSLRSAEARVRWQRHPQFTASFEEVWVTSGRLQALAPDRVLEDFSGGAWRPLLLGRTAEYPAVQPQHERRKFRARAPAGSGPEVPSLILRFAGLGAFGEARRSRAQALAGAGVGVPPAMLAHGFLVQEFREGRPAGRDDSAHLVPAMAGYLAHLRRCHPASQPASDLRPMVATNVDEALGARAAESALARLGTAPDGDMPTALDGRMLPHEWIRTAAGYVKVDAVDHHDDHFFPGSQDIAWDVAGTCVEFGFERETRRAFLDHYVRESGDRDIERRLSAYAVAYLAFRLGYAALAAEQLGAAPDGARFRAGVEAYRRRLASELEPGAEARWRS